MALTISSHQHCHTFFMQPPLKSWYLFKSPSCLAASSKNTTSGPDNPSPNPNLKSKRSSPRVQKMKVTKNEEKDPSEMFAFTKPKKPRCGRRSEAAAVEDFMRGKLERTFASIREQNPEILNDWEGMIKERVDDDVDSDDSSDGADHDNGSVKNSMVVEEEDPNWPLDADVGWGTRASEYFEKYPVKNVVGEDGFEIDWEGEIDNGLVKEINCLEWESFAFRPSPLIVLVFERYNRSSENWKILKELEKAAEVYWKAKDRLPPRTVKLDINIEKDLAYALKVKECPQILFLRGNRILYREKETRTSEELFVHFEDLLPFMAQKLGGEGLIRELCNGFQLLMDDEKGLITLGSLKNHTALLGLQEFQDDEIEQMIKEGDLDGDGALNQLEFCILMFRLSPELLNGAVRLLEEAFVQDLVQ